MQKQTGAQRDSNSAEQPQQLLAGWPNHCALAPTRAGLDEVRHQHVRRPRLANRRSATSRGSGTRLGCRASRPSACSGVRCHFGAELATIHRLRQRRFCLGSARSLAGRRHRRHPTTRPNRPPSLRAPSATGRSCLRTGCAPSSAQRPARPLHRGLGGSHSQTDPRQAPAALPPQSCARNPCWPSETLGSAPDVQGSLCGCGGRPGPRYRMAVHRLWVPDRVGSRGARDTVADNEGRGAPSAPLHRHHLQRIVRAPADARLGKRQQELLSTGKRRVVD